MIEHLIIYVLLLLLWLLMAFCLGLIENAKKAKRELFRLRQTLDK